MPYYIYFKCLQNTGLMTWGAVVLSVGGSNALICYNVLATPGREEENGPITDSQAPMRKCLTRKSLLESSSTHAFAL